MDKGLEEIQIINKVKTENQAAGERETLSHQPNPLPTATESNTTFFPRLSKEKKKNALVEKTYGAGEEGEESQRDRKKSQTQEEDGQTIEDLEIFQDRTRVATSSVATGSDAVPKTKKTSTGFTKKILQKTPQLFGNPAKGEEREEDAPDQGNCLRSRLVLLSSLANGIKKPNQGRIDWTFVVYDHRTEGEIHFNKRDFNLYNGENSRFDAYGQENGDGTLDGAVYGLFAAEDIYHPDTSSRTANEFDTGVVFQEGDLVAMATTDRNGDGSFLVITEAPGTRYDYDAGKTIHTDWQDQAPKNLYQEEKESAAKEKDIERFIGHNPDGSKITAGNGQDLTDTSPGDGTHTEGSFWKYSSNQVYDSGMLSKNKVTNQTQDVYREEKTTGRSPLGDLESSNGNCWIGRPLLLSPDGSTYYIKELSRSEGYELSVFGKNPDLSTNRQAFSDGEVTVSKGSVQTTGVEAHVQKGEFTYTVQSSDTDQGYRVRLSHIPEGAQIHRTTRELVWDDQTAHPEEVVKRVPILAKEGDLVMVGGKTWKASLGDLISVATLLYRPIITLVACHRINRYNDMRTENGERRTENGERRKEKVPGH